VGVVGVLACLCSAKITKNADSKTNGVMASKRPGRVSASRDLLVLGIDCDGVSMADLSFRALVFVEGRVVLSAWTDNGDEMDGEE